MGILTDPSVSRKSRIGHRLIKHNRKVCIILYLAAVVWFCCLGHLKFNHATYLSENALSPGLVESNINFKLSDQFTQSSLDELNEERKTHKSHIPYAWLKGKMRSLGLEVYTHNYTLRSPFSGNNTYYGKNVYGILRASRTASTEGIVLSTPYRPPNSIHTEITASVPILLAFAQFARNRNYWAKDIIFLIIDHEQLGMQAWLEAYHQGGIKTNHILDAGNLEGRSGALQAAVNLEFHSFDLEYIDVKIEGLNGQLPNLDLFNVVQRLCDNAGIPSGYKKRDNKEYNSKKSIKMNIQRMLTMLFSQASGVPTGNHGLFHRYRIEALTMEGVKATSVARSSYRYGAFQILGIIEGICRSLNNLLERFHQSYFFYILIGDNRFVSIGDYIPCLILMAGSLLIKAYLLWTSTDYETQSQTVDESTKTKKDKKKSDINYTNIAVHYGFVYVFGAAAAFLTCNKQLYDFFAANGIKTELYITILLVGLSIAASLSPSFSNLKQDSLEFLHIVTLLHLSSGLIMIGLLNFALGFMLSTIIVPLAIMLDVKNPERTKWLSRFYTILLHPLIIVYLIVFGLTLASFRELSLSQVAKTAAGASMDAITFAVIDSIIYNNWTYNVICFIFFPAWILIWNIVTKVKTGVKVKYD